ncbi:matrix metalloproteinase-20-like [Ylistrum balloti]|uniref:matrix metalloproteinase-20-like n=1 Tax=Ylistrum balloti TaxID=509963 RepID=UPI002905CA2B|nr:matrix metalloproteinase-20-like [Ylistrum balloti]
MKTLSAIILLFCYAACCLSFSPDKFFEDFGYLDEASSKPDGTAHSPEDRERAIRHFQKVAGLPETGQLDKRTVKKMSGERCGVKDLVPPRKRRQPGGPLEFYAVGTKWDKSTVTYSFVGYTRQLEQGQQRRAISNALSKWSAHANINFREVSGRNADILISYGTGNHGDNYPFDRRGGTLAHAFFPGSGDISGDTHFDDSEQWTLGTSEGTNLEIVAAHEFGHALGIGHSNVPGALMAPYYAGYDPNYGLANDDIQAIQSIYGARTSGGSPTRPPRRTVRPTRRPTTTTAPQGTDCSLKFDDIFTGDDRRVYAVRGTKVYKFRSNANGVERGRYIRRIYKKAPKNPGAIVKARNQRLYFFKGYRFWRYTRGQLDRGYPKVIKGEDNWYRNAKAAVLWRDGFVYLFKGSEYSVWAEGYTKPPRGYPKPISSFFRGVPTNVEAAIRYNRYTYFFKGHNYFKVDDYRRVLPGYPKKKASAWLGCGSPTPK